MVPARKFEDLIVWQLAVKLRGLVYQLTKTGPASRDFPFRNQIRDAAASAPRNISEGFRRFNPPEFAHFMNIACSSLAETQNHLQHGRDEKYFSDEGFTTAWRVNCRALRAGNRLHAYLRRCGKRRRSSAQSVDMAERPVERAAPIEHPEIAALGAAPSPPTSGKRGAHLMSLPHNRAAGALRPAKPTTGEGGTNPGGTRTRQKLRRILNAADL
jgi:four helix bundle protein